MDFNLLEAGDKVKEPIFFYRGVSTSRLFDDLLTRA